MTKTMKDSVKETSLIDYDRQHLWHPYAPLNSTDPLYLVRSAAGCYLHLDTGQKLLDGMSSWWSTIHGYNHPLLNKALVRQSESMSHVMFGGLTHEPAVNLGKHLVNLTPQGLDYVFYADSGSVAVEVAIKMALQYWLSKGSNAKYKILSFHNGYHGDTFAAMAVCDPINGMHHLFKDVLAKNIFAPAPPGGLDTPVSDDDKNVLRKLFNEHHHQLAAVIIEPIVQGAGGMRIYSSAYLTYLNALCREYDVLLIADEIATGFGRTGKLFACEHSDISPDILCLGKALTGGYMSFAATLCNRQVAEGIGSGEAKVLMHGPTFMANPLACSVAIASIELLLSTDWYSRIQQIQRVLGAAFDNVNPLPWVKETRSLGAIGIIELHQPVNMKKITRQFVDLGVWLRPFGKLVYTMPPYTISDDELQMLTQQIITVIQNGDIF